MAVPASALGSGRQRHLLSEAQTAAAYLREIPQDAPATQVTNQNTLQLSCGVGFTTNYARDRVHEYALPGDSINLPCLSDILPLC